MLVAADSDPMENTLKRAIIYVHVLDQSAGATRFRMHRDVEEGKKKPRSLNGISLKSFHARRSRDLRTKDHPFSKFYRRSRLQ